MVYTEKPECLIRVKIEINKKEKGMSKEGTN